MRNLVTTLACAGLLIGGAALASAEEASGAASSNSAAPASSSISSSSQTKTEHSTHGTRSGETRSERIATREMCRKYADEKGLTGTERTDYLRSCHLEVVPR